MNGHPLWQYLAINVGIALALLGAFLLAVAALVLFVNAAVRGDVSTVFIMLAGAAIAFGLYDGFHDWKNGRDL